ncbi:MAG: enolase C-terminal domain-like protein, partial [Ferruginibacter sp.]
PDWKEDLDRLKKVREAVGREIGIMMDANQGMDTATACQLANAVEDLNIFWFEEPIEHQNFDGYKAIKSKSRISLAMGEREFDSMPLKLLLSKDAIDIWQPDLLRLGSVEAWRESAVLAAAYHIPVLPHYYKDYDVPLLCTIPNGIGAESFDWIDPLIDNPMMIKDGFAYPHEQPGWGFNFLDKHLREIKL